MNLTTRSARHAELSRLRMQQRLAQRELLVLAGLDHKCWTMMLKAQRRELVIHERLSEIKSKMDAVSES